MVLQGVPGTFYRSQGTSRVSDVFQRVLGISGKYQECFKGYQGRFRKSQGFSVEFEGVSGVLYVVSGAFQGPQRRSNEPQGFPEYSQGFQGVSDAL